MQKSIRFTLRISPQEKETLEYLAGRLDCSESQAVRLIARGMEEQLKAKDALQAAGMGQTTDDKSK